MHLKLFTIILLVSFLVFACQPARTRTGLVVIDRNELQNFADTFFAEQLKTVHIPGVVLVFVQKGEVIFAKGYGYANLEHATPLDPDSSIVRIGSISKPFVATAVMQLVEQGKLDLHADVNQYLPTLQIEDNFLKPVTLAQLLTHTPASRIRLTSATPIRSRCGRCANIWPLPSWRAPIHVARSTATAVAATIWRR